jgi:hypothetical protein
MSERDTVTVEDLAVRAAKDRLASLDGKPEYLAALARKPPPEHGPRRAAWIAFVLALAGTIALGWTASGLAWVGVVVLGLLTAGLGLGLIGFAIEKPLESHGVAVLSRSHEGDNHTLQLLLADGRTITAHVIESTYNLVKPGDVGVARFRPETHYVFVGELERL